MNIKIDVMLSSRGKSRYWLAKEVGVAYPTMMRLCNNQTESVKFSILEKICIALNCDPNDILEVERD